MSFTFTIRTDSDTVTIRDEADDVVATFALGFDLSQDDDAQRINDLLEGYGWDATGEAWSSDDLQDGAGDTYTQIIGGVVRAFTDWADASWASGSEGFADGSRVEWWISDHATATWEGAYLAKDSSEADPVVIEQGDGRTEAELLAWQQRMEKIAGKVVINGDTAEPIRPASLADLAASDAAAMKDGGAGFFADFDGTKVFVL